MENVHCLGAGSLLDQRKPSDATIKCYMKQTLCHPDNHICFSFDVQKPLKLSRSPLQDVQRAMSHFPVLLAIALICLVILAVSLYNLYLHPLSKVPGPRLWIAFPPLKNVAAMRGLYDRHMREFHEVYGHVVRCVQFPKSIYFSSDGEDCSSNDGDLFTLTVDIKIKSQ